MASMFALVLAFVVILLIVRTDRLHKAKLAADLQLAQSDLQRIRSMVCIPDGDRTFLEEAIEISEKSVAPFLEQTEQRGAAIVSMPTTHATEISRCISQHLFHQAQAHLALAARQHQTSAQDSHIKPEGIA